MENNHTPPKIHIFVVHLVPIGTDISLQILMRKPETSFFNLEASSPRSKKHSKPDVSKIVFMDEILVFFRSENVIFEACWQFEALEWSLDSISGTFEWILDFKTL